MHLRMLWLDGVCEANDAQPQRKPRLHRARAPTSAQLAGTIAHRVCRHSDAQKLARRRGRIGLSVRTRASDDAMDALRASSITYRIATGKHAGRKVVTLQTLPGDDGPPEGGAGKVGGFSLHAGVAAEADESEKLERLCRYIDAANSATGTRSDAATTPQGRARPAAWNR